MGRIGCMLRSELTEATQPHADDSPQDADAKESGLPAAMTVASCLPLLWPVRARFHSRDLRQVIPMTG